MSVENKNQQGNLRFPAAYILAIVLSLGVYSLGFLLRNYIPGGVLPAIVTLSTLVFSVLFAMFASYRMEKRQNARSVVEENKDAEQRLARMTQNPQKEWRKLRNLCRLAWGYVILLWFLCLGTIFSYGTSGLNTDWIILEIIPMFFLIDLVAKLIPHKEPKQDEEILKEKDFPMLYTLARKAGGEKLKGKKLSISVIYGVADQECNAAVVLRKKNVTIWLGAVLLCVLDEAELNQVLLHEFAHLNEEDNSEHFAYNRIMNYLTREGNSIFSGLVYLALKYFVNLLYKEGNYYFLLSSRLKEGKADDAAAALGDPQKQCSALAKIAAHNLHVYEREIYENHFTDEEIRNHALTERADRFREALISRGDVWRNILEHEIPSRVDTHPTFRQRWEALGFCEYSLDPSETDSPFAKECRSAVELSDAQFALKLKEEYDQLRKEYYLDPCAVIEAFESRPWDLAPDALREPMLAYYKLGKPEKLEAICDRVLAETDNPFSTAYSTYWKGILLLRRYDKAGIDYLYRAMETNSNYIDSGCQEIGRFCTMMGLQQELEEYRSRAPEFMQLKVDRSSGGIHAKANLTQAQLPEGWLEKILDFAVTAGGEGLEAVYLVKEIVNEDYAPSSFVLRFSEGVADETVDQLYNKVFRLLDDWPEDYEFSLYVYEDSMEKPLTAINGSCVYCRTE